MRVVAVSLLSLIPVSALAAPKVGDNFLGGRVVEKTQLFVVAGYPDTQVGFRIRLPAKFEITPNARFAYPVGGFGTHPTELGTTIAADLRWQILTQGDWAGSITGSLPVHVGFDVGDPDVAVGVGLLHPGFAVTYALQKVVDFDFGLQFQDDLWFQDGAVWFTGAFPFFFGVELEVAEDVAVGMRFEGGPAFVTDGFGAPGLTGRLRVVGGVAFSF